MSSSQTQKIVAGDVAILARRYAQALVELAEKKKAVEAVEADLLALEQSIEGNKDFHLMATHPRLPKSQVLAIVKKVAEDSKFNDLTTAFLLQVARNQRLAEIGYIIDSFKSRMAELRKEHTAYVKAATALSETQISALSAQLGKMVSGTVKVVVEQDSSLMGGMMIQLGSRLIDASVKGKLTQIERQLKTQQEAA